MSCIFALNVALGTFDGTRLWSLFGSRNTNYVTSQVARPSPSLGFAGAIGLVKVVPSPDLPRSVAMGHFVGLFRI